MDTHLTSFVASMGGSNALTTVPTTVRLHQVSLKYRTSLKITCPLVSERITNPAEGWVGGAAKRSLTKMSESDAKNNAPVKIVQPAKSWTGLWKDDRKWNASKETRTAENDDEFMCRWGISERKRETSTITALENVSMVLESSQMHLVMGETEAGKSSLLKVKEKLRRKGTVFIVHLIKRKVQIL